MIKQKILSPLILLMIITGCGKKPKDSKGINPNIETTESTISIEGLNKLQNALRARNLKEFESLLNLKEISLNHIYEDGETLLTLAIKMNLPDFVEALIESNTDINAINIIKETPLLVAARMGREGIAKRLILAKAKLNEVDSEGNTALLVSIKNGHQGIALTLIHNQADIRINNNQNYDALKLAEYKNLNTVADLLRSIIQGTISVPEMEHLRTLFKLGDIKNLNPLLTEYPELIRKYDEELNPYLIIINNQSHDTARDIFYLIDTYGANPNGSSKVETSPLIESVKIKNSSFVSFFSTRPDVNIDRRDNNKKTALIHAVELNHLEIVKILMNKSPLKKYTDSKDGKKITYNACRIACKLGRTFDDNSQAEKDNEDIKDQLGCSFWSCIL